MTAVANKLLSFLPLEDYARIFSSLEQIDITYGNIIYESGDIIRHVYFPNSGIISLLAAVEESSTHEVAIIGNEGMVGLPVFLGVNTSKHRAIVQGTGTAMRMNATDFQMECKQGGSLPRILQHFTYSLLMQISQSAVCYRFHSTEARLARWLLMSSDRMKTNQFHITHNMLSNMLGVRRETISKSAMVLRRLQLISYNRGNLTILNRAGLESVSCKCYEIIKEEEKSFSG